MNKAFIGRMGGIHRFRVLLCSGEYLFNVRVVTGHELEKLVQ